MIVDMWLQACAFDIVSPQHTHNHVKMMRNISGETKIWKFRFTIVMYSLSFNYLLDIMIVNYFTIAQL